MKRGWNSVRRRAATALDTASRPGGGFSSGVACRARRWPHLRQPRFQQPRHLHRLRRIPEVVSAERRRASSNRSRRCRSGETPRSGIGRHRQRPAHDADRHPLAAEQRPDHARPQHRRPIEAPRAGCRAAPAHAPSGDQRRARSAAGWPPKLVGRPPIARSSSAGGYSPLSAAATPSSAASAAWSPRCSAAPAAEDAAEVRQAAVRDFQRDVVQGGAVERQHLRAGPSVSDSSPEALQVDRDAPPAAAAVQAARRQRKQRRRQRRQRTSNVPPTRLRRRPNSGRNMITASNTAQTIVAPAAAAIRRIVSSSSTTWKPRR